MPDRAEKKGIDSLLKITGVNLTQFDYEKLGYTFEDNLGCGKWAIREEQDERRQVIGILHKEGYVEIRYDTEFLRCEVVHLRQIEHAKQLYNNLINAGCTSIVELPPPKVVRTELEKLMAYTQRVCEMFKEER